MMAPSSPILIALGVVFGCAGAVAGTPEYAVKAAYVYNFAKFVEWPPANPTAALTVCIYGKTPLAGFLDETVRGKLVHGLPVEVKRMPEGDEHWDSCAAVFFGATNRARIQTVLAQLKGRSILTLGESEAFAEGGGMITLVVEGDRVRFDINLAAVTDARLKISSKLMELARRVRPAK